jgi:hypothetical protein
LGVVDISAFRRKRAAVHALLDGAVGRLVGRAIWSSECTGRKRDRMFAHAP